MARSIKQYEAFTGNTVAILPEGDYLQVKIVDPIKKITSNQSLWKAWRMINQEAEKIAAIGSSLQTVTTRDTTEATIEAINKSFGVVSTLVITRANKIFNSTFGGPNPYEYMPYPIRWPGESMDTLRYVMAFVSSIFQIPNVRSNEIDRGILDDHATIILRPLFDLKAEIMKEKFGYEVMGEVSADEIDAFYSDSTIKPPLHQSLTEQRDTTAQKEAKSEKAKSVESVKRLTEAELNRITDGKEVWSWVPGRDDWLVFGAIEKRLENDGPHQVSDQPFPFTTDAIGGPASDPGFAGPA